MPRRARVCGPPTLRSRTPPPCGTSSTRSRGSTDSTAGSHSETRHTANTDPGHSDRVARFLTFSCWDHHVHGKGDHRMYDRAAQRLLSQYQKIAHDSLYTAIVCGELQEVQRILAERPAAAREPGGARGWPPILYLCFTRFTHPQTTANAVEIARLLLDCGADPNVVRQSRGFELHGARGRGGRGRAGFPAAAAGEGSVSAASRGAGPSPSTSRCSTTPTSAAT